MGSLEILGSPASLVRSIGNGVSDFFRLPYEGLTRGPGAFVSGVSRGTTSFVKHISKGNTTIHAHLKWYESFNEIKISRLSLCSGMFVSIKFELFATWTQTDSVTWGTLMTCTTHHWLLVYTTLSQTLKGELNISLSGTLTSITNLATSLARNMDRLSLDEEHYTRQEEWRRQLPESLGDGLRQGLSRLGISLLGKWGCAHAGRRPFMQSEFLHLWLKFTILILLQDAKIFCSPL